MGATYLVGALPWVPRSECCIVKHHVLVPGFRIFAGVSSPAKNGLPKFLKPGTHTNVSLRHRDCNAWVPRSCMGATLRIVAFVRGRHGRHPLH